MLTDAPDKAMFDTPPSRWIDPWPPKFGMGFGCCCTPASAAYYYGYSRYRLPTVATTCCPAPNALPISLKVTFSSLCTTINGLMVALNYRTDLFTPMWYGLIPADTCFAGQEQIECLFYCNSGCSVGGCRNFLFHTIGAVTGCTIFNQSNKCADAGCSCSPVFFSFANYVNITAGFCSGSGGCNCCGCPLPTTNGVQISAIVTE